MLRALFSQRAYFASEPSPPLRAGSVLAPTVIIMAPNRNTRSATSGARSAKKAPPRSSVAKSTKKAKPATAKPATKKDRLNPKEAVVVLSTFTTSAVVASSWRQEKLMLSARAIARKYSYREMMVRLFGAPNQPLGIPGITLATPGVVAPVADVAPVAVEAPVVTPAPPVVVVAGVAPVVMPAPSVAPVAGAAPVAVVAPAVTPAPLLVETVVAVGAAAAPAVIPIPSAADLPVDMRMGRSLAALI
jgi:hypothetical protein